MRPEGEHTPSALRIAMHEGTRDASLWAPQENTHLCIEIGILPREEAITKISAPDGGDGSKICGQTYQGSKVLKPHHLVDKQATISVAKTCQTNQRSKHIQVKEFYSREKFLQGDIGIEYCCTGTTVSDIMTRPHAKYINYMILNFSDENP